MHLSFIFTDEVEEEGGDTTLNDDKQFYSTTMLAVAPSHCDKYYPTRPLRKTPIPRK